MLDLYVYESGICDQCGFHESLHTPGEHVYAPQASYCTIAAGADRAQRELAEQDRAFAERVKDTPEPVKARMSWPSDGRKLNVRKLSPLEVAERREKKN